MHPPSLLVVHLLALAVYFGSTVFVALLIEVVGAQASDAVVRRHGYAEIFRVYSPLTIAVLLVIVMTGAWSLTGFKQALGPRYLAFAVGLLPKLSLAFVLIMNATYLALGVGFRLVRADQGGLPVTEAALRSTKHRLRIALWLTIVLILATAALSSGFAGSSVAGGAGQTP